MGRAHSVNTKDGKWIVVSQIGDQKYSTMIPYPSSSVWYINSSSQGETSEGSGVAIRLRKKGHPCTEQTFVLTCSHVIRRVGRSKNEFGPKHDNIWALPAGYGYHASYGIRVTPVSWIHPLKASAPSSFYDQPIEEIEYADWALLEFDDQNWTNCTDPQLVAREWSLRELRPQSTANPDECSICGYPDGYKGFSGHENGNDGIVRPKTGYSLQKVEKVSNGIVTFDGTGSRAGMSGGGVFLDEGGAIYLTGIHRARYDAALQLKAISARTILHRLNELGLEPVSFTESGDDVITPLPVGLETFSTNELQTIVTTLLNIPVSEYDAGSRIELSLGSKRKLTMILSDSSVDSMQRMALKNDIDLLATQESQIRYLKDLLATGAGGAMAVPILIERATVEAEKTICSIRDRVDLMVEGVVSTSN